MQFNRQIVYKTESARMDLIVETYGKWMLSSGIEDMRQSKVLVQRRRNLMGKHFKSSLVILNNDTWNHLDDYR